MSSGHVARDLSKNLRSCPLEDDIERVLLPVHFKNLVVYEEHLILLPHMLWAKMYQHDEAMFMQQFLGGQSDNASRFWSKMEGTKVEGQVGVAWSLTQREQCLWSCLVMELPALELAKPGPNQLRHSCFSSLLATSSNSKVSEVQGNQRLPWQVGWHTLYIQCALHWPRHENNEMSMPYLLTMFSIHRTPKILWGYVSSRGCIVGFFPWRSWWLFYGRRESPRQAWGP